MKATASRAIASTELGVPRPCMSRSTSQLDSYRAPFGRLGLHSLDALGVCGALAGVDVAEDGVGLRGVRQRHPDAEGQRLVEPQYRPHALRHRHVEARPLKRLDDAPGDVFGLHER